jgi:SAM-dependent methyltransferase
LQSDRVRLEWDATGHAYRKTISAGKSSSAWLRDVVLKPVVHRLLGDRSNDAVLDVGTGGGWLFDDIRVREAYGCDIVQPDRTASGVDFRIADLLALPYDDARFDAIVASVVLCYCEDLTVAATELGRVVRKGGSAVVALVHPYFYRTGQVEADGTYRITADLSAPTPFEILIGGKVGPFTYYPHRPDSYVNAFLDSGWRLSRMEDAFIPRDEYRRRYAADRDEMRRATNVPLFSFFRFERA